jgi:hypothetical protein
MVKIFVNEAIETGDHSRTVEFEVTDKYPLVDDELSGPAAKDWACLSCKQPLSRQEGRDYPSSATKVKWT